MRFLIPLGIKVNFFLLPLICSEQEGLRVASLGTHLQTQVHYQAPSQANVWELTAPSLALQITPPQRHISLTARREKPSKSPFSLSNGPEKREAGERRDMLRMPKCHESTWIGLHCTRQETRSDEGRVERPRTQRPEIIPLQIIYSTNV